MGQQDNKPNNETTVDGKPLVHQPQSGVISATEEYINEYTRDDDPLLSPSERGNTRADLLHETAEEIPKGISHPIQ